MENTQSVDRLAALRTGGAVVAVLTSRLPLDLLADQPLSLRLAAVALWAMAFVGFWELLIRAFSSMKHRGNGVPF